MIGLRQYYTVYKTIIYQENLQTFNFILKLFGVISDNGVTGDNIIIK